MEEKPIIRSERLSIRQVVLSDAAFLLRIYNMPKWLINIGDRNIHTIIDAEETIRTKMLPQYEKYGYGNNVISLSASGEEIGVCGLYHRPGLEIVDIGYALLPEFEGHGYAFEAAQALMNWAIAVKGLCAISGITIPENKPSVRILEKLGLVFEKMITLPDGTEELMYFEWNKK